MFVTLKLAGILGKRFGRVHRCIAPNVAQAIRYLEVNNPLFRQWVLEAGKRGIVFNVSINKSYELEEDELIEPVPEDATITIVPLFAAAGGNTNWIKVILGVGLIAAGAFGVGFLGLGPMQLILTGSLLLLSGLMGKKTPKDDGEDKKSMVFSGQTNTSQVGDRVPVVYGVIISGSIVLSAAVRSFIIAA
jgi:predicted phage tail protein